MVKVQNDIFNDSTFVKPLLYFDHASTPTPVSTENIDCAEFNTSLEIQPKIEAFYPIECNVEVNENFENLPYSKFCCSNLLYPRINPR